MFDTSVWYIAGLQTIAIDRRSRCTMSKFHAAATWQNGNTCTDMDSLSLQWNNWKTMKNPYCFNVLLKRHFDSSWFHEHVKMVRISFFWALHLYMYIIIYICTCVCVMCGVLCSIHIYSFLYIYNNYYMFAKYFFRNSCRFLSPLLVSYASNDAMIP